MRYMNGCSLQELGIQGLRFAASCFLPDFDLKVLRFGGDFGVEVPAYDAVLMLNLEL